MYYMITKWAGENNYFIANIKTTTQLDDLIEKNMKDNLSYIIVQDVNIENMRDEFRKKELKAEIDRIKNSANPYGEVIQL